MQLTDRRRRIDCMTTYELTAEAAQSYQATSAPAPFDASAERLAAAAPLLPGQAVPDVACGTGVVARHGAEGVGPGGGVVGLDLNEAMLAVARREYPELEWRQGDAIALPFEDDSFDVVLRQAALMFIADRVAALREMGRV